MRSPRPSPPSPRRSTRVGYPEPRIRERGYATLLRTIVGQQVSVAAAASVWHKLEALLGDLTDPARVAAASDETLRAAGLSRQKAGYARSLADEVTSGRLDLDNLPADDEEAIAQLVRVKGIGRWSAEIYLLFAEGRAGRLAGGRPGGTDRGRPHPRPCRATDRKARPASSPRPWRPHRGAAAIFTWHHYGAGVTAQPV